MTKQPHIPPVQPTPAEQSAFRANLGAVAKAFADAGGEFTVVVGDVVHIRSRHEPSDVRNALERLTTVPPSTQITLSAALERVVLAALLGKTPQGMVGGRIPEACLMERRINISGGTKQLIKLLDEISSQAAGMVWLVTYEPGGEALNSLRVGFVCPDGSQITFGF